MAVTITNENKNNATVANEGKSGDTVTWDEATDTWDESTGTWDNPNTPMVSESKNTAITITNESRN